MPKKFTYEERKRMLDRLEKGATATDLRSEFKIKDARTLEKQLGQAREEQQLRVARTELITESLRDHLSEIRSFLESWAANIKAPSPPSCDRDPFSAAEQAEEARLFEGMRQHLPFPDLWKHYKAFKLGWDEYVTKCRELHDKIVENARKKWGLATIEPGLPRRRGLAKEFSSETLDRAIRVAAGDTAAAKSEYSTGSAAVAEDPDLEDLVSGGRIILFSNKAIRFKDEHRMMIAELAQSSETKHLVSLVSELRELEKRIHDTIEETLLRRDYILYSCRLCPGGRRLPPK